MANWKSILRAAEPLKRDAADNARKIAQSNVERGQRVSSMKGYDIRRDPEGIMAGRKAYRDAGGDRVLGEHMVVPGRERDDMSLALDAALTRRGVAKQDATARVVDDLMERGEHAKFANDPAAFPDVLDLKRAVGDDPDFEKNVRILTQKLGRTPTLDEYKLWSAYGEYNNSVVYPANIPEARKQQIHKRLEFLDDYIDNHGDWTRFPDQDRIPD